MNRTDRLLAIVLELQRKGQQRAEDLAVTFEVSKRTLYRDMQALSEASVPIIAIQKKGYSLARGYFLPPLRFTTEEALILALGSDFMIRHIKRKELRRAIITFTRMGSSPLVFLLPNSYTESGKLLGSKKSR